MPEAISQMAENSLKMKTGARGLHSEIERVLMPHMFNVRKYKLNKIKQINIDMDKVLNPTSIL
jgi:ATP-dependent protease Clp ATPase subunit